MRGKECLRRGIPPKADFPKFKGRTYCVASAEGVYERSNARAISSAFPLPPLEPTTVTYISFGPVAPAKQGDSLKMTYNRTLLTESLPLADSEIRRSA